VTERERHREREIERSENMSEIKKKILKNAIDEFSTWLNKLEEILKMSE
jgi:hypothetical protein